MKRAIKLNVKQAWNTWILTLNLLNMCLNYAWFNKGLAAIVALNRKSMLTIASKCLFYKQLIRPILIYACPVWSNARFFFFINYKTFKILCERLTVLRLTVPSSKSKLSSIMFQIKRICFQPNKNMLRAIKRPNIQGI